MFLYASFADLEVIMGWSCLVSPKNITPKRPFLLMTIIALGTVAWPISSKRATVAGQSLTSLLFELTGVVIMMSDSATISPNMESRSLSYAARVSGSSAPILDLSLQVNELLRSLAVTFGLDQVIDTPAHGHLHRVPPLLPHLGLHALIIGLELPILHAKSLNASFQGSLILLYLMLCCHLDHKLREEWILFVIFRVRSRGLKGAIFVKSGRSMLSGFGDFDVHRSVSEELLVLYLFCKRPAFACVLHGVEDLGRSLVRRSIGRTYDKNLVANSSQQDCLFPKGRGLLRASAPLRRWTGS